jgi:hypothetical protein
MDYIRLDEGHLSIVCGMGVETLKSDDSKCALVHFLYNNSLSMRVKKDTNNTNELWKILEQCYL